MGRWGRCTEQLIDAADVGCLGLFAPGAPAGSTAGDNDQSDTLGKLGETLGNLLQQGLSGGRNSSTPPTAGSPAQNDPAAV